MRLTIEKLVPGGDGMARSDDGVVFVPGTAPGELVRAEIVRARGGARHARVLEIISASADRVERDCAHAERCGGCDWLHHSEEARARHKHDIALDGLRRIGRFTDDDLARVRPLLRAPADRALSGRRRCRVVIDAAHRATFSRDKSHERVAVESCAALHPRLEAAVLALSGARLPAGSEVRLSTDDRHHVVAATADVDSARALVGSGVVIGALAMKGSKMVGDGLLRGEITAGAFDAISDAAVFSQATRAGGAAIRDTVLEAAGDLTGAQVLELFAGSGHLSLPLAQNARVTAVEGDARAVAYLKHNAALAASPITVHQAFIDAQAAHRFGDADVVVADPPRTGLVEARELFAALRAPRVVLVSCDIATGARDVRAAINAGYALDWLQPIDAFPRTHHLEWVVCLSRRGG